MVWLAQSRRGGAVIEILRHHWPEIIPTITPHHVEMRTKAETPAGFQLPLELANLETDAEHHAQDQEAEQDAQHEMLVIAMMPFTPAHPMPIM